MRIHIGTSGYAYPEWRGTFYPDKLAGARMFAFYAERFSTVEINATFYRMPTPRLTGAWRDQAPAGFRYALKAPRRITHDRRLADCEDLVRTFAESARELGPHLGPLLFQLAPTFRCDVARLAAFLRDLPDDLHAAVEFRHESWLTPQVYDLMREHRVALCIADFGDRTTPVEVTARHGYFRLRDEGYQAADLERWADTVCARAGDWDDAFVYFKHEEEGKGPEFARAFKEMLTARGASLA